MTDRELMQMALDALEELRMEHSQNMKVPEEWYSYYQKQDTALEALRDRLAQPEPVHAIDISQERVDETVKREHEPYGYLWFAHQMERRFTHYRPKEEQRIGEVTPIYTAPPKREWVGLTEDDVHDAFNYVEMVKLLDFDRHRPDWCEAFASACEATLRHKNGGNK